LSTGTDERTWCDGGFSVWCCWIIWGYSFYHIDGDAGDLDIVGQASSDLPCYPTASSGPSNYPISKSLFLTTCLWQMAMKSTNFMHTRIHLLTWHSPDWHTFIIQIDHYFIDGRHFSDVIDVTVRRGANIDSDHMLVVVKLRARICRASNTKPQQLRRFSVDRLKDRDVASRYYYELEFEHHTIAKNAYKLARMKERRLFRKKARQLGEKALIEIERHRSIQDSGKF
jgi:hypothetical protein